MSTPSTAPYKTVIYAQLTTVPPTGVCSEPTLTRQPSSKFVWLQYDYDVMKDNNSVWSQLTDSEHKAYAELAETVLLKSVAEYEKTHGPWDLWYDDNEVNDAEWREHARNIFMASQAVANDQSAASSPVTVVFKSLEEAAKFEMIDGPVHEDEEILSQDVIEQLNPRFNQSRLSHDLTWLPLSKL